MTADTVGGVWTYCMELCRNLPFVEFHLVTSGAVMNEGQKEDIHKLSNAVVYETNHKLEWMEEPWNDIDAAGGWLLDLEKKIRPDLVHLNSFSFGSLPFRAPKMVVAHSDVFSWWQAVRHDEPPPHLNEYYSRVQNGLHQANVVVAPSFAYLRQIQAVYQKIPHVVVVHNGRTNDLFTIGEKKPVVFGMGRLWDEAKNMDLLATAAAAINHEVRIAGESRFGKNEIDLSADNVLFRGRLSQQEIARELAAATVFVLPAKYEPFGLSALEAAFSGCALVLGDISSLREIWEDAALFIDTGDAAALSAVINELMENVEMREHYSRKAVERAEKFSSSAMADDYHNIYRELSLHKKEFFKMGTA